MIPTNNDALMNELKHDYERDRWMQLWQRYQVLIIGVIAAIILGTAGNSYWKHVQSQKHMEMTSALYDAIGTSTTSPEDAAQSLLAFAEQHANDNAGFMAKIQAATLLLRADKKTDAMLQLESALADTGADADLHAVTTLKYVQVGFDRLDAPQVADMLAPLQKADSAYRFAAWELGALNAYRANDQQAVKDFIGKILADDATPKSVRVRAADMQRVLVK